MKYWILATEYPPYFGGGISTYVHTTARMFCSRGHEVTVFIYEDSLVAEQISIHEEIRIVRFGPVNPGTGRILGFIARMSYEYALVIEQYVKKEGFPHILETQDYNGISYYIQQYKWLGYENFSGLNILVTCHSPAFLNLTYNHVPVYQFPHYWTGQMERSCIRSADLLISPSRYLVQEIQQRMNWEGVEPEYLVNPVAIDQGVNSQVFRENHIICFGKLSPLKGTFKLLQDFSELWDSGFPHPLHIIGGTQDLFHPEGLTMEDCVRRKYGDYIRKGLLILEGALSPDLAKDNIQEAHVVLVPSLVDNLPYTVLEAMSWGKVILASKQGGQAEIIQDGENGFLFDHNTHDDFRNKLNFILGLEKKCLEVIGENAIRTVREQYSPDFVYRQKMKLIEILLSNKTQEPKFPFVQNTVTYTGTPEISTNDRLSIVIPYFNMGEFIEDCVRSIIDSNYPDKEIIIVNDGSTDEKSWVKLSELEKRYPLIVYHKKNEGLPLTRNFGAQKASGKFLSFLDADDTVEKTYFSKAINVLNKYDNVHFVGCWVRYFGDNTDCWPAFNPEPPYLLVHNMVNSSALIYKKQSFLDYGQNDPELVYGMEDWDSVINMVENNCGGVVLPEFLFNYRVRKGSMARNFTRVKQLHLYRLIGDRHKDLYAKFGNEIAHLLNANGSGIRFENPSLESPNDSWFPPISLSSQIKERIKRNVKRNKYLKKIAYKLYKQLKH